MTMTKQERAQAKRIRRAARKASNYAKQNGEPPGTQGYVEAWKKRVLAWAERHFRREKAEKRTQLKRAKAEAVWAPRED